MLTMIHKTLSYKVIIFIYNPSDLILNVILPYPDVYDSDVTSN